ncbi:MAG: putative thiol-disulfide isomerase and thioredoxin [Paucimonas sp.]|nr:putative thiol-disulfide isomerase and thioredoxin [Paucimonas sp.]
MRSLKTWLFLCLFLPVVSTAMPEQPYDELADAGEALQTARDKAAASNKKVLVVFGANWCSECVRVDRSMREGTIPIDMARYELVKVDVGRFNRNLDIAHTYGNPIRKGIPAAVVLSKDGQVLYSGSLSRYVDPIRHYSRHLPVAFAAMLALGGLIGLVVFIKKKR